MYCSHGEGYFTRRTSWYSSDCLGGAGDVKLTFTYKSYEFYLFLDFLYFSKKIKYSFFVQFFNFWRKLFPNNGRLSLTVCYPVFTFKIRKKSNSLLGNDHLTSNRAGREGMGVLCFACLKKSESRFYPIYLPYSIKFRKKNDW